MTTWTDIILILAVLANLKVLGSARLVSCIRFVAFQGIILGLMPLVVEPEVNVRLLLAMSASTILKGFVFPWLLLRTVRESGARREIDPIVGYTTSLLLGLAMIALSLWISSRLPMPPSAHRMVLPAALFTAMVGLFIITSRRNAITQVLGYLVLENGIFTFGMSVAQHQPLLVELGILLDVFMAVFVMGIAIYHITREFDHIDTQQMSALKD